MDLRIPFALCAALPLACGEEAMAPEPLKFPGADGAKVLVALIDDGGPLHGEVYDLKNSGGVAPALSLAVIQALYFNDTLETLKMKPGPMTITTDDDPLGRRIPLFDKAYEARIEGGVGKFVEITEVEETYYKYRTSSLVSGSVRRWDSVDPLESVRVCAPDKPEIDCAMTEAGAFTLEGFEPGSEVVLTLDRSDLLPTAVMVWIDGGEVDIAAAFHIMDYTQLETLTSTLGVTPDMANAGIVDFITFRGVASSISDVVGELSPASGQIFPHFAGGIAFNVDPGDYRLFLSRPDKDFCGPSGTAYNWFGTEPNEARLKVIPGFVTHVQGLVCH